MKFSDIYKKGYGEPDTTDIIVGGIAIDIKDKRAYSHAEDGTIFQIGVSQDEIDATLATLNTLPPIGAIIMYAGQINNLPSNWVVCVIKSNLCSLFIFVNFVDFIFNLPIISEIDLK